jgi:hypothetical protein
MDLGTIPEDVAMLQEVMAYMCRHLAVALKMVPCVNKIEHSYRLVRNNIYTCCTLAGGTFFQLREVPPAHSPLAPIWLVIHKNNK